MGVWGCNNIKIWDDLCADVPLDECGVTPHHRCAKYEKKANGYGPNNTGNVIFFNLNGESLSTCGDNDKWAAAVSNFNPIRGNSAHVADSKQNMVSPFNAQDNVSVSGWNSNNIYPGTSDIIRSNGCAKGEYVIPNCECGGGTGYPECYNNFCCKKCNTQDDSNPDWSIQDWQTKFSNNPNTQGGPNGKLWERYEVHSSHKQVRCPQG